MNKNAAVMAVLMTAMLLATAGCDDHDNSVPDDGIIVIPDCDSPEIVMANLQTAFTHLDAAGYERQIADDFTYEPDSNSQALYPNVNWASWNRDKEIAFVTNFFNNVDAIGANLRVETIQGNWAGTEAHLRYTYAMTVTEAGNDIPYRANVTLDFRLDGTDWVLDRWYDEQGLDDPDSGVQLPSLGQRRGAFAVMGVTRPLECPRFR